MGRHTHRPEPEPEPLRYAGFWKRLAASVWDVLLVGIPWFVAFRYSLRSSSTLYIAWSVGWPIIGSVVGLYLLARFGGTPGKLLQGIRVVQLDGSPITWKHAVLRNSVDLVSSAYAVILFLAVVGKIDFELVRALAPGPAEPLQAYWREIYPPWVYLVNKVDGLYTLSEAVVMLTNQRRRAIHDYIAGTVVVIKPRPKARRKHRR